MKFVYYVPFVRGPLNSAKLTPVSLLSAPVCSCWLLSRRERCSPVQLKHSWCLLFPDTFGALLPYSSGAADGPCCVSEAFDAPEWLTWVRLILGRRAGSWSRWGVLPEWAGVLWCLWLLHVAVSWSTAFAGTARWGCAPASWPLGREAAGAEGQQANLCANVTADRWQPRCAEAGGTEPGAAWRKARQPGCPAARAPCWRAACGTLSALAHTALSPSSWVGWHQGRRAACPTATMRMVPKKEQLGSSSLGFVTLATCQW